MGEEQICLACIASGSGTDFESIAKAWLAGWIPEVSSIVLIATAEKNKDGEELGCITKAKKQSIPYKVVVPVNKELPREELGAALEALGGVDLIFLVGCIFKIPNTITVEVMDCCIPTYNIHPADPKEHGGQGMYGLEVHMHVLTAINDKYERGMASLNDRFFTTPTVHEVVDDYDQGKELMRVQVEIPHEIVRAFVTGVFEEEGFEDIAEKLQKVVLPYEHQMLPLAVRIAAKRIIDQKKQRKGG